MNRRPTGVAVLEISALGAALVVLDALDKAANVRLLQAELNDYYGYFLKITGDTAALRAAVDAAEETARRMQAPCVTDIISAPADETWKVLEGARDFNPLIEQDVVFNPAAPNNESNNEPQSNKGAAAVASQSTFALGLIETQGFTAVIEAIDTACKAADVQILGREKLGGGYITILIKGDVAAVKAAIEAGKSKVDGLGTLIAAHVIPRPSEAVLSILPQS